MSKILRNELINRLGEPNFSYSSSMYWYDLRLRAVKRKNGFELQMIKINDKNKFSSYSHISGFWNRFTVQKKLAQHYDNYINELILGEDDEDRSTL